VISLAGRQHLIGYHLAGRRITARLDHGVLHLLDADRTLLRSLPNPLSTAEQSRLRDAAPPDRHLPRPRRRPTDRRSRPHHHQARRPVQGPQTRASTTTSGILRQPR
jgi:hypothetical protein